MNGKHSRSATVHGASLIHYMITITCGPINIVESPLMCA